MKHTPAEDEDGNYEGGARLLLSGTMMRKLMSEGKRVPPEFSRPEVIAVLKEYYEQPGTQGRGEAARVRHGSEAELTGARS